MTDLSKGGAIGTTALYYAGVTAPIIGAGMATFMRSFLVNIGMISSYYLTLIASIFAAMTGIAWYLIFVRWSKRGLERIIEDEDYDKTIIVDQTHLTFIRRTVETRISLTDLKCVTEKDYGVVIQFMSASPVLIPKNWFSNDQSLYQDFMRHLNARVP